MAFSSPTTLNPPTIPQMIESLSNLHQQLSTALQQHFPHPTPAATPTPPPAQDGGDQIEDAIEPSEPTEAPEEEHRKEEIEHAPEINGSSEAHRDPQLVNLLSHIEHLKKALETTKELDKKLNVPTQSIETCLEEVIKRIKETPVGDSLTEKIGEGYLEAISKDMKTLKFQIPSYRKLSLAKTTARLADSGSSTRRQSEFKLPNLYGHKVFDESPAFIEIQKVYNGLSNIRKKCFLYFAVFPENVELKKRFLTHWWIGEGLLNPSDQTPENVAGEILQEFVEKGLIVPVKEEQKKVKKRFTMPPLVRSTAIKLAIQKGFLNYDSGDNPTCKSSNCDRIFLVKGGGSHPPQAPTKTEDQKLEEKIQSIFNVSQPFPDSALEWLAKKGVVDTRTIKVVEWLLKLKDLKVFYLGRWQSAADENVIEVESLEFLKGLNKMKQLKLLSLQGIFWINKLPKSINTLYNLRVLDLKCCHNLEKLPEGIGSLKNLTHLDVTGCFMLNRMPKGISKLTELRVLKGFVTGKSSLNDLKRLKNLRKLSINTKNQYFPEEMDLHVLQDLGEHGKLRNLTIVWGAEEVKSGQPPLGTGKGKIERRLTKLLSKPSPTMAPNDETSKLPKELEKLEMVCVPMEELPSWLNPSKLTSLEKLYIRGGRLKELGKEWMAKVVRLKYMMELNIEWRELRKSFPNLSYLQKVRCPSVTLCPCDANGVWIKP